MADRVSENLAMLMRVVDRLGPLRVDLECEVVRELLRVRDCESTCAQPLDRRAPSPPFGVVDLRCACRRCRRFASGPAAPRRPSARA